MKEILNELFVIHNKLASYTPTVFQRYLDINYKNRLIIITGARGTGKTTLVLQHYLKSYNNPSECLYFSADNPLALKSGIYDIGKEFFTLWGSTIIVDEVHKQPNWSQDIKALYDSFPDKKIIILGSSKLNILSQKSDLSRRAVIYNLKGLSFREFLDLKYNLHFEPLQWKDLTENHLSISMNILKTTSNIRRYFEEYKRFGYYPFFNQFSEAEYGSALHAVIDKIIYEDIPTLKIIKSSSSLVFKKLIAYLAMSKSPTMVVSSVCNELDIPKETLYEYLDLLDRAEIINIIRREDSSVRSLKFSKILLSNPNLYYAISNNLWEHTTDLGNVRESFFVSQVREQMFSSTQIDFLVRENGISYKFEIGGKNKNRQQIINVPNSYILKDDIELGYENVIPLYLAGFLY